MDRRSFFRSMIGGVAAVAAVRTWPFRVFSFPSGIQRPPMLTRFDVMAAWQKVEASRPHDWYFDEEVPILWVPGESVIINSWNPKTERLIVTRGIA